MIKLTRCTAKHKIGVVRELASSHADRRRPLHWHHNVGTWADAPHERQEARGVRVLGSALLLLLLLLPEEHPLRGKLTVQLDADLRSLEEEQKRRS